MAWDEERIRKTGEHAGVARARSTSRRRLVVAWTALLAFPPSVHALDGSEIWVGNGNQSNANYGYVVSTAGDVNGDGYSDILVGARNYDAGQQNEGRVSLYTGGDAGPSLTASWTFDSDQTLAFLGSAAGPAGDVNGDGYADVIVGAPSYDSTLANAGRAFVFHGSPSGLSPSVSWFADGDFAGGTFGNAVGTAGDVNGDGYDDVIVGARGHGGTALSAGRAYVFHGSADGLGTNPAWSAGATQENAAFGWSVATAGDVNGDGYADVIVGAFFYDGTLIDEGAAYVYLGSSSGLQATPAWTKTGGQGGANFGWSVGPAGDVDGDGYADVIVGARSWDTTLVDAGRAFVFRGGPAGLASAPSWTVDGTESSENLGWSVGTAGDVNGDGFADVLVGGYRGDEVLLDAGRARLFLGSPSGPSAAAWTGGSGQESSQYGWSVGTAGDVDADGFSDWIVGAPFFDDGQSNEGRAFVYRGGAEAPEADASWRGSGGPSAAAFGSAVALADVNGDGYSDVLASDPSFSAGTVAQGRVLLFAGTASGPDTSPDWADVGGQADASFGRSVAGAGDVNGDGWEDVIVGAPLFDGVAIDEGRAFLYFGSSSGLSTLADWIETGLSESARFGQSVCGAGDWNGDGFADVAVGAPGHEGTGAVFVYFGSAIGPATPPTVLLGTQSGGEFGASVSSAGDVDRDGFSELVVGAPGEADTQLEEGRAYLYRGTPGGLTAAVWQASGGQDGARFGESVASAGDVDADGYADVLVVARLFDGPDVDEGRAFLYRGTPQGLEATPSWTIDSEQTTAEVTAAVGAGDVNLDGFGDVLVSSQGYTGTQIREGRVRLYLGGAAGLATTAVWERFGGSFLARLGSSVAGRGDVLADGFGDVVLGARGYADSVVTGGAVFLHAGNGGSGPPRPLRQLRTDGVTPIALLGASDSEVAFRWETWGRSAAGRTRVRPEWEARELGDAFDPSEVATGSAFDSGAPQAGVGSRVLLDELVSELSVSRFYHWRVRVRSASPYFPISPWWSPAGNGPTETDLRTSPPPVSAPSIAVVPTFDLRAHPSPFRSTVRIAFTTPRRTRAHLAVHDVTGRRVRVLLDRVVDGGAQSISWDGRDERDHRVACGVYFVRLDVDGRSVSSRIVHVR